MSLLDYLENIYDSIFQAHKDNSMEQFLDIANEVAAYQSEVEDNGVARLNVLKTFLVATKNHPDPECLAIRAKIKEEYYDPLSLEKFGKVY